MSQAIQSTMTLQLTAENKRHKLESVEETPGCVSLNTEITPKELENMALEMKERALSYTPFSEEEIELLISSLKHVIPLEVSGDLDFDKLANLVLEVAHLSHKDWEKTIEYSQRLEDLLLPHSIATEGSKIDDAEKSHLFRSIFERVLRDGKWEDARQASRLRNEEKKDERPWVVVVTGLNGIRKTTTIYLECYKVLLSEALVVPEGESDSIDPSYLPIGANSFFRQLDHMIAVLANLQFVTLYKIQFFSC